jgi:hypothetical protein
MAYDLTPEALAFIAVQEPRHITKRARFFVQKFSAAEDQLALLEHAVALRKTKRKLEWRSPKMAALRLQAWERRGRPHDHKHW